MKKVIFEGIIKPTTTWVGISFQPRNYKDKFGKVKEGESRACYMNTKWGQLMLPNYKEVNKFGKKKIRIIVEVMEGKIYKD